MSPTARPIAQSAAQRTAHVLREEILQRDNGQWLGSEDELLERLGVSRPTLRQAARLLEHEQVLTVRRGVKGGYYARKPDVGSVAHVAAFYLRARGTTLRETFIASQPLLEEAIQRAARLANAAALARFAEGLAGFARSDEGAPAGRMLRDEAAFIEHVLELAANPPIELFIRILYQFGLSQTSARIFERRPDRIAQWTAARERLAEAIVGGDPEMALLLARRRRDLMYAWVTEDFEPEAAEGAATQRGPEER